ncbi:nucleic acid binding OB-fold tRNA/helicase-type [Methanosalsum zhilinae DSM 4017]|uniref:Nucleic acid binding OB-fold tRNA/helicase-type n=1 Tax=Methanosalsum zhilinae (strain DSM 4017 / NBRC 107636 / OCM 62 / WeN5) TaxID=679901 RepID=F7XKK6_METZD|nr:hypothetical protein [Methanosalsum zhilinae]AEH60609.1 nucleic acid binding OB-fold tRNA/helicase-type [Methanosalsum zhilinae DSM 4017]
MRIVLGKEEKVVVILLLMAFSSLLIAYCTYIPQDGRIVDQPLDENSEIGDRVFFTGEVLSKRLTYTGDHLVLRVDTGIELMTVFVPSGAGAIDAERMIHENTEIKVTGFVDEYREERQVVVYDINNIEILSNHR